jgi:hypothetical protein
MPDGLGTATLMATDSTDDKVTALSLAWPGDHWGERRTPSRKNEAMDNSLRIGANVVD